MCVELEVLVCDIVVCLGEVEVGIFKVQVELLGDIDFMMLMCQVMVEGYGVVWFWYQVVECLVE